jgi:hypothetical protein
MYWGSSSSSSANDCQSSRKAIFTPILVPLANLLRQMINTLNNSNPKREKIFNTIETEQANYFTKDVALLQSFSSRLGNDRNWNTLTISSSTIKSKRHSPICLVDGGIGRSHTINVWEVFFRGGFGEVF